jgi:hypothetical protein
MICVGAPEILCDNSTHRLCELSEMFRHINELSYFYCVPVPVAARSKTYFYGRSPTAIVGSNPTTHHVTRHNTPFHNILSTAPQLIISQKALGTLPEDGSVMPKHVGATIHN